MVPSQTCMVPIKLDMYDTKLDMYGTKLDMYDTKPDMYCTKLDMLLCDRVYVATCSRTNNNSISLLYINLLPRCYICDKLITMLEHEKKLKTS